MEYRIFRKVEIFVSGAELSDVRKLIENHFTESASSKHIKIQASVAEHRSSEAPIIVAIVAASATATTALLRGLLAVIKELKGRNIEIHGRSGGKLVVPADTPLAKIDQLIEKMDQMDRPQIHLNAD